MAMRAVDIIAKKRDGLELTEAEIDAFIQGFVEGDVADYQAAAFCMAVLLQGMTVAETSALTMSMVRSGEQLDMSSVAALVADKHSTGGVGDKVTLVLGPLVAACGQPVGKMSGRGLGFSGGTLDKLESIPGFSPNLTIDRFLNQVKEVGLVVAGQTANLVPADRQLYALRDVTATVPSLPLIASSVMSKKIAAGANVILLDVKVGHGAFMQTLGEARQLAEIMVQIGHSVGRRVAARVTDMNQPLGYAVGNALEVKEAVATLKGQGPSDFTGLILEEAAHLLQMCDLVGSIEEGKLIVQRHLEDGSALTKFAEFVKAQGGNPAVINDPEAILPHAPHVLAFPSPRRGYLEQVNARVIGETAVALGGGRAKKGDTIDYGVGLVLKAKVGDHVEHSQCLCEVHARTREEAEEVMASLQTAYRWSDEPVEPPALIKDTIT